MVAEKFRTLDIRSIVNYFLQCIEPFQTFGSCPHNVSVPYHIYSSAQKKQPRSSSNQQIRQATHISNEQMVELVGTKIFKVIIVSRIGQ